jgi:hypothetical protein
LGVLLPLINGGQPVLGREFYDVAIQRSGERRREHIEGLSPFLPSRWAAAEAPEGPWEVQNCSEIEVAAASLRSRESKMVGDCRIGFTLPFDENLQEVSG